MGSWSEQDISSDVQQAKWLDESAGPSRRHTLSDLLPTVFESYVRVLYPAEREISTSRFEPVRWADAARAAGGVAHANMQWRSLTDSTPPSRQTWTYGPPRIKDVTDDLITSLSDVLASHTEEPDLCWFAIWEGNTVIADLTSNRPLISVAGLNYLLLRGSIHRASQSLRELRPHLWWPADHSWCVATHFDFDSAYIGCSQAACDDLITNQLLECWEVSPTADITVHGDHLNQTIR